MNYYKVFLNVIAISNSFLSNLSQRWTLVSLAISRSWGGGGGGGGLDEILIFPFFLRNEERKILGMEETKFKTDHSQHGND